MYTLRKVSGQGQLVRNISLGSHYRTLRRVNDPEHFAQTIKSHDKRWENDENVYGAIWDENFNVHPLYGEDENYIMTESGKTFERLTDNKLYNAQFESLVDGDECYGEKQDQSQMTTEGNHEQDENHSKVYSNFGHFQSKGREILHYLIDTRLDDLKDRLEDDSVKYDKGAIEAEKEEVMYLTEYLNDLNSRK
jgi:hypothetical protein